MKEECQKLAMVPDLIKYQENITYTKRSILNSVQLSPHADLEKNCEKNFRIMIPNIQILTKAVGIYWEIH
jgi:hypothetical protein